MPNPPQNALEQMMQMYGTNDPMQAIESALNQAAEEKGAADYRWYLEMRGWEFHMEAGPGLCYLKDPLNEFPRDNPGEPLLNLNAVGVQLNRDGHGPQGVLGQALLGAMQYCAPLPEPILSETREYRRLHDPRYPDYTGPEQDQTASVPGQPEWTTDKWTEGSGSSTKCAHCDHVYGAFNYVGILLHCREHHKPFYRHKWDTEVIPSGQASLYPDFAPVENQTASEDEQLPSVHEVFDDGSVNLIQNELWEEKYWLPQVWRRLTTKQERTELAVERGLTPEMMLSGSYAGEHSDRVYEQFRRWNQRLGWKQFSEQSLASEMMQSIQQNLSGIAGGPVQVVFSPTGPVTTTAPTVPAPSCKRKTVAPKTAAYQRIENFNFDERE